MVMGNYVTGKLRKSMCEHDKLTQCIMGRCLWNIAAITGCTKKIKKSTTELNMFLIL